jgi:hypothetical protein
LAAARRYKKETTGLETTPRDLGGSRMADRTIGTRCCLGSPLDDPIALPITLPSRGGVSFIPWSQTTIFRAGSTDCCSRGSIHHIAQSRATIGRGLDPEFVELPSGPELRNQPAWMSAAAYPGLGRLRGVPILRKQGSARRLPGRMMRNIHAELAQSLVKPGFLGRYFAG